MIIFPNRSVDKSKLFAEKVRNSHHKLECLDCSRTVNLDDCLDYDTIIYREIADHIANYPGHKMLEVDDLQ